MFRPNPIIVLGALFLVGMAGLLFFTARGTDLFGLLDERAVVGLWYLLVSLIPAGLVFLALNLPDVQPGLAMMVAAQLAVLFGAVVLAWRWLRRFSNVAAFFGSAFFYMVACFGTNWLWVLRLFSH